MTYKSNLDEISSFMCDQHIEVSEALKVLNELSDKYEGNFDALDDDVGFSLMLEMYPASLNDIRYRNTPQSILDIDPVICQYARLDQDLIVVGSKASEDPASHVVEVSGAEEFFSQVVKCVEKGSMKKIVMPVLSILPSGPPHNLRGERDVLVEKFMLRHAVFVDPPRNLISDIMKSSGKIMTLNTSIASDRLEIFDCDKVHLHPLYLFFQIDLEMEKRLNTAKIKFMNFSFNPTYPASVRSLVKYAKKKNYEDVLVLNRYKTYSLRCYQSEYNVYTPYVWSTFFRIPQSSLSHEWLSLSVSTNMSLYIPMPSLLFPIFVADRFEVPKDGSYKFRNVSGDIFIQEVNYIFVPLELVSLRIISKTRSLVVLHRLDNFVDVVRFEVIVNKGVPHHHLIYANRGRYYYAIVSGGLARKKVTAIVRSQYYNSTGSVCDYIVSCSPVQHIGHYHGHATKAYTQQVLSAEYEMTDYDEEFKPPSGYVLEELDESHFQFS